MLKKSNLVISLRYSSFKMVTDTKESGSKERKKELVKTLILTGLDTKVNNHTLTLPTNSNLKLLLLSLGEWQTDQING